MLVGHSQQGPSATGEGCGHRREIWVADSFRAAVGKGQGCIRALEAWVIKGGFGCRYKIQSAKSKREAIPVSPSETVDIKIKGP